jgi:S-adenosylmethionine:tRNA ribosyltransferase-isomerase
LFRLKTSDFDFELPEELIAQAPSAWRDESRLLVLHRVSRQVEHRGFKNFLDYLCGGDVLVLNNSRVIPARLRGSSVRSGGKFEILLLEENTVNDWWVMMRPGKRARIGTRLALHDLQGLLTPVQAIVIDTNQEGHRRLQFEGTDNLILTLEEIGEVPLPPYIRRNDDKCDGALDYVRYQTVFAQTPGSVAAPTAGLHFTEELLDKIRARGVQVCCLTLHVGLGTFAPVKAEALSEHVMHEERFEVPAETGRIINEAKRENRRVVAVGTTTLRVLETLAKRERADEASNSARMHPSIPAGTGRTRIFIHPPYSFKIVDGLLTNFHLPRSTLLMLASAFATPNQVLGRDLVLSAYREAVRERYHFFSYGDAMLIL